MTERKPPQKSWDSFVEEQICDAQAAGEFDNLPGFGKPIPDLDDPHDENWWIKKKVRRENLSALPPGLAIRVEVEKTLSRIWGLVSESAVRRETEALNEKIRRAHFSCSWGPPNTTMPLNVEEVVRQWRRRKEGG